VKTHATYDAPLSAARARWPVILYTHSRLGFRFEQQAIVEQLASEGAIVVTVSIPYLGGPVVFPDGRVVDPVPAPPLRTLADVEPFDRVVGQEIEQARRISRSSSTRSRASAPEACGFLTGRLDLAPQAFGFSMGGGVDLAVPL
jgi:dienelactone hydrolase